MNECRLHQMVLWRVDSLVKLPGDGHNLADDHHRPGFGFAMLCECRTGMSDPLGEKESQSRGMNKWNDSCTELVLMATICS